MDNNHVRIGGTVKRDAEAGRGVLDFAIEVVGNNGYANIIDCRLTESSAAFEQIEGFVNGGEHLEVIGHLERMTRTEEKRVGAVMVTTRVTSTVVFVDEIVEDDE